MGTRYLTIDESPVLAGRPHRGACAKYGRALHTEAGKTAGKIVWGGSRRVTVDGDVRILLASSLAGSCAIWDAHHGNTSLDGDIGDCADDYPYAAAVLLGCGEVREIGIFTPHESLPVPRDCNRQFLRIVSAGVHGREDYFTENEFGPATAAA